METREFFRALQKRSIVAATCGCIERLHGSVTLSPARLNAQGWVTLI